MIYLIDVTTFLTMIKNSYRIWLVIVRPMMQKYLKYIYTHISNLTFRQNLADL